MSSAVTAKGLVKAFGATRALDDLDLDVHTGEVHGFLGPNGAGKTVTIRILLGLLRADNGMVSVFDRDPWHDSVEIHRRLAYVPGDTNLWPNLSGGEVIDLLGSLRGGLDAARRNEFVDRFDLDPTKKCRTYSKGNRQKVALVAALASRADLLILDEPTSGLDPLMEAVFQDSVHQARQEGRTILLSSHVLAQVEKVCDRVTIIRKGRDVQSGTLDELRTLTHTKMTVELATPLVSTSIDIPGAENLRVDGSHVHFDIDHGRMNEALVALTKLGVRSLESRPPTLEDLFLRQYHDELHDAGVEP
ncbi:MAG: ATP-binding cassette domain-containing protein [Acidimicrobiia bacterium]